MKQQKQIQKQKIKTNNCIDFVITWVDGSDEKWIQRKRDVDSLLKMPEQAEHFRDWGFLPYVLKSIELYAPWVHHIFIVTDRQVPSFLDRNGTVESNDLQCENINSDASTIWDKITIMDHMDFIPKEYLPTFNSHTIELNFHRIPGLSEQFVYFNDDTLLTNPCEPEDFFEDGKPVDSAILNGINGKDNLFAGIQFHNMALMNVHYSIQDVRRHLSKWLHPAYGMQNIRTILLLPFQRLQGIHNPHGPMPLLKSTYEKLWKRDKEVLHKTCLCKTRQEDNVSVYVMRYEQLLSGNFIPAKVKNRYLEVNDEPQKIAKALRTSKSACINDVPMGETEFLETRKRILKILQKKYDEIKCAKNKSNS